MITKTGAELAYLSKEAGWLGAGFNLARRGIGAAGSMLARTGNAARRGILHGYDKVNTGMYSALGNRGVSDAAMRRYWDISGRGRNYLNRGMGYAGRNAGALGAGLGAGMYFGGGKGNAQQPVYRMY
ncbi:MAG: hypothetical protein ACI4P0_02190 [Mailhella sp.]